MLTIYDKATTSFNNLGIGVLRDFKSDPLITEVLNGLYNLEFEYVTDGWLSEYLIEENIIRANGQPFRIWNVKKNVDKTTITILAKHIFFDSEKTVWLEDVAPTNLPAQMALTWCLNRAKDTSPFQSSGDCTEIASARYVRTNLIDAVYNNDNAILKRFGGEIELNNYNVIFHNRRGTELGLEIRQKKNLTGADYELDFSQVATRIMPIGNDGLLLPEKYIDSPIIDNYFSPLYYKYECNIGINEEEGITEEIAYQMMRDEVEKLFESGVDKPSVNIKIDFIELSKTLEYMQYSNLETAHLGDSCKIYIPSLKLSLTTRIVKTVYNCLKKRITSLELGSIKPNIATSRIKDDRAVKNALSIDTDTSVLQKAKEQATSMINHPFAGHLFIDETTGQLYIMDTTDPNTAQKVWKWGLGGLGFSSTGINGPYGIAITQDGSIVADYITTGQLNTNLIQGYGQLVTAVSDNTGAISLLTQSVGELNSKIQDIADITTAAESTFGVVELTNVNESQPIMIKVHPVNGKNISYLYPRTNLYPSTSLYMTTRTIRFKNTSTNEVFDYELFDDLLYYDDDNYDEFYFDYDSETVQITKKCEYAADGSVVLKSSPIVETRTFPSPEDFFLTTGNYQVSLLGYTNGYISVRCMASNIYTSQFATRSELSQTASQIRTEVSGNYATKSELATTNTTITQTATSIQSEVSQTYQTKLDANTNYTTLDSKIDQTATSITSTVAATYETKEDFNTKYTQILQNESSISSTVSTKVGDDEVISKINQSAESVLINANKIGIEGLLTAINNDTSTTIDGSKITTGTITANQVSSDIITAANFSAQNISADKIKTGTLTAAAINLGSGKFKVTTGGVLTATSGTIGGWTINSGKLGGDNTYLNPNGSCQFYPSGGAIVGWNNAIRLKGPSGIGIYNSHTAYGSSTTISAGIHIMADQGNLNLMQESSSYGVNIRSYCSPSSRSNAGARSIKLAAGANISMYAVSGYCYAEGNGVSSGKIKTDNGSASSRNVKTNIKEFTDKEYEDAIDLLRYIKIYDYDYKYDLYEDKSQYGFILDEIEEKDNKFFKITKDKAIVTGNHLDFNLDNLNDNDKTIEVKKYNSDTLDKFLLTCIKKQQIEIDRLIKEMEVLKNG